MIEHPVITQEYIDTVTARARRMQAEAIVRHSRSIGRLLGQVFHLRG